MHMYISSIYMIFYSMCIHTYMYNQYDAYVIVHRMSARLQESTQDQVGHLTMTGIKTSYVSIY